MDADRNEQLTVIIKQMRKDPVAYTMTQAKDDLLRYYQAGTFAAALESLQNKTATNAAACQSEAKTAKETAQGAATTDTSECNPTSKSTDRGGNAVQPPANPGAAPAVPENNGRPSARNPT